MTTTLNITQIASGTSVLGGKKAVLYAPQKLGGMQGLGAKAGVLPRTDTAAPGSMEPLNRFIISKGLETDHGYENGAFVLRIGGFENDAHLKRLLTEEFPAWYKDQPESQETHIKIDKNVPILALDNKPEEKKAYNLRAWTYRNSSVLVGIIATISGMFHFLRGSFDDGRTPPFTFEDGKPKFSAQQFGQFIKDFDLKQAGSACFVLAAAFLALLSQKTKKNRSVDEILSDVEERLQKNNPDIALTPEHKGSIRQMMDWMVKNPWKVNASLNLIGNVIHTNQNIQNHRKGMKLDRLEKQGVEKQAALKFLKANTDEAGNIKRMRTMEMVGTVSAGMGLSLILGTPQMKAAAFPGLDAYAKQFGETKLKHTQKQTIRETYDAVDAYPSNISSDKKVKRSGNFLNTLQDKHMEWNAWLSILSNWGYLFDGLFGTEKFSTALKSGDFKGALSSVKESFSEKGGALYVAMFTTNTMADILTGISKASFSHAPETIYDTVASWIDERFDKDTDPQLLEQFSYQLAFYLASTKEISMNSDQISRGVITRLAVKHGRPVNYDRKIAQEYLQLEVLSPFTANTEKYAHMIDQFDKTDRLAAEVNVRLGDKRQSQIKQLAERKPQENYEGRIVDIREREAQQTESSRRA